MSGEWACPVLACGHINDLGAIEPPRPGDVSFCAGCRELLLFALNGFGLVDLRLPTFAERRDLLADPKIRAAYDAARRA